MTKTRITIALILTVFTTIFTGCTKDDNTNENIIKLEDAILTDFPLVGITPVSINIKQPTIVDNEEIVFGEINIVVPSTVSLKEIASITTSTELNLSKFSILPNDLSLLNYETQNHIYTIVNALNESEELLHYIVNIKHEIVPTPTTLTITDFRFEASKNAQLTNDVTIEKRVDDLDKQTIYLFVPTGTDFSNLTPTVTFDAEEVFYTQESSVPIVDVNTVYPSTETSFDFTYPKRFIIVLKDNTSNRVKWVDVFVDVKNPVEIKNTDITTPDITSTASSSTFRGITSWKNVGNHVLSFRSATTYENKVPNSDLNFITARRNFTSMGLAPKESADINVTVIKDLPKGEYKSTAVFYTKFANHEATNDVIEQAKLNVTTNVLN
ncbi:MULTISPECIES: hypothetical protein [unclassified Cellulophaga]|uniref:hypothetical protein n=1 Tax=unclassified Cellulophaga TaxID=2634405 RepID=UPI0026E26506|nr:MULTISPECIES: hypothetical protein [unclassified Cellulophaga]MDO6492895.1 hypothetical protein [Cellulophaga sp. 2_MG-2023]MDO6496397.1 hypothetical protein [Cellulophaga sp. 3_MG-2023]